MSLGNVPKRNNNREDTIIRDRLRLYAKLTARFRAEGMAHDPAEKRAFGLVAYAKHKDIVKALAE